MLAERTAQAAAISRLRQAFTAEAAARSGCAKLSLGAAEVDAVLGGGLARGALHEIAAGSEPEMPAATGFALALVARTAGPVVWIAEDMAMGESGALYGPGLDDLGVAPERLVLVAAPHGREAFWALEEVLRQRGLGLVVGEIRSKRVELNASRRLSFAAGRSDSLALLLRCAPDPTPSAATTRWIVKPVPSGSDPPGPGPPRLALMLTRNRHGRPGCWELEWNRVERCFEAATAHREPVVLPALNRPYQAASR